MKFVEMSGKCMGIYYLDVTELFKLKELIENLKLIDDVHIGCTLLPSGGVAISMCKKD